MRHIISILLIGLISAVQADPTPVRVGVLKFGTVNWELDVIQTRQLDRQYGIQLEVVPLGSKNATHVALQGGAVDVIVSDWLWVARQRGAGRDYHFAPYSNATGGLWLHPDNPAKTLADLRGQKIGVAGGALDKTWLLLRAYSLKNQGEDLAGWVQPQFGAPPLLNALSLRGELDGAINFWHYAARLKAAGFKPLVTLPQMLTTFDIQGDMPLIGWVFKSDWAHKQADAVQGLLKASQAARQRLLSDATEWQRLRPHMQAEDDSVFNALIQGFRDGIPNCFGAQQIQTAQQLFGLLSELGGNALTGGITELDRKVFWQPLPLPPCG